MDIDAALQTFTSSSSLPRKHSQDLGGLVCEASSRGNLDTLKELLDSGISVNSRGYDKRTPLHLAAAEGHINIVQYLVENHANIDAEDRWGNTPLSDAIRAKNDDIADYLISKGAKMVDEKELAIRLCAAACKGIFEDVKRLVYAGASVNGTDYDRRTPLHLAASEGNVAICEFLIQQGADVNAMDRWSGTPLRDAVRHKHDKIANLLRKHGAELMMSPEDMAAILLTAALRGDVAHTERLLKNGVDVNSADYDRRTALHIAAAEGHESLVKHLLKAGANVNAVDRWGSTPIQDARRRSHHRLADILLESGAENLELHSAVASVQFTAALQRAIPILCEKGNWPYCEVWLRNEEMHVGVVCSALWYCDDSYMFRILPFRKVTEGLQIFERQGIIGDVLVSKQPMWLDSVQELDPRRQWLAEEVGLKSGMVIPVKAGSEVAAILLFTSFEERKIDSDLMETFTLFFQNLVQHEAQPIKLTPILQEQKHIVYQLIAVHGVFNSALIQDEVDYFYSGLGIGKYYFEHFPPQVIAKHIHTFIAGKKVARVGGDAEDIRINFEQEDANFYLCPNIPSLTGQIDSKIQKYLEGRTSTNSSGQTEVCAKRLTQIVSTGPTIPGGKSHLTLYVLEPVTLPTSPSNETDIWKVAAGGFLRMKSPPMREKYQEILSEATKQLAPVIRWFEREEGTIKIMIALRREASRGLFSTLSQLLTYNNVECTQKFVEHFTNGYVIFSVDAKTPDEYQLEDLTNQVSLCVLIPIGIAPLMMSGLYSTNELTYAYTVCQFTYYFLRPKSDEYIVLQDSLKNDPLNYGRLVRLRKALQKEYLTETRTIETMTTYPQVVKKMYQDFERRHRPPMFQESAIDGEVLSEEALVSFINKTVTTELDIQILRMYITFNQYLLKTNFYQAKKSSIAYRFDPTFLASQETLPEIPFSIFLVIGKEFRGFHVRFRDIARGGVRIIRSSNLQVHNRNKEFLFEENYGLAYTQQLKNKDIPEGGSKGTILLGAVEQDKATISFQKYIDGLLDLLLGGPEIVDHYQKPEFLCLGPDEGTADLMDWAACYARARKAPFWKAFTTGKTTALGGIPHDLYGMTTRGVHQYVLGILKYRGLREEDVRKLQTGGPDGDLGGNEIKISKDKTIGVVDGSGVLYDPEGIDREELLRLANERRMVKFFRLDKLTKNGFLVLTTDREVTLPDGTFVENGFIFRNEFHLSPYATCDLFVPCGGRPEAVHVNNYHKMLDENGNPRIPIIIEGANLFFTQDARLALEKAGVFIIRDASANKGGVTSSSLEVLAALSFSDAEYAEHMQVKGGVVPQFYQDYVEEVQKRIEENARLEFEFILAEHTRTKTSCTVLTDQISEKINKLNDKIKESDLWDYFDIRKKVLQHALPKKLLEVVGLDVLMRRVPDNYLQAMFSAFLSSRYVYKCGFCTPETCFADFMQGLLSQD